MIKVYDRNMKAIGILENAYQVGYETPLNQVWSASFRLPLNDPKKDLCHHFNYVEVFDNGERVDLFRIMPTQTRKSESDRSISYECEHVLACLHDDGIDDYAQWSNFPTEDVLSDMLAYQEVERWVLGNVEIRRFFHYGLEKEDLLPAIFSVVKPFDEPYQWTWDTTVYPWVLNLEQASTEIVGEARWGRNIKGITKDSDPVPMATRIYPYGYGEGVNQLNISEVNPTGRRYVQDDDAVAEYGIMKYHWVDRRFEDAESLYASALARLKTMARPKVSYSVDLVELKSLGDLNRYDVGKLVRIVDDDLGPVLQRVYDYRKPDLSRTFEVNLEIGDKLEDTGTTQADMDRRQKINETYSQGATNIDSHPYADNCDPDHPAVIRFYLDEGLVNVNTMNLSFQVEPFRAYSRAIEGGGALVDSTESGGASTQTSSSGGGTTATSSSGGGVSTSTASGGDSTQTSSSGGGTSTSTQSGGGTTQTSSGGGDHHHNMFQTTGNDPGSATGRVQATAGQGVTLWFANGTPTQTMVRTHSSSGNHTHDVSVPSHSHDFSTPNHSHSVDIPSHTHDFSTPNHSHDVTIPNHTHDVDIPAHTHQIVLPDHTHEIEHGIFVMDSTPSSVEIRVDGNLVEHSSTSGNDIDIIPYLAKDDAGKVTRGTWHEVTITPNGLGRVTADIISRLFIQSRTGGVF